MRRPRVRFTVRGLMIAVALTALAAALATREYYAQRGRALLMRAARFQHQARMLRIEIEDVTERAEWCERVAAEEERAIERRARLPPEGDPAAREANLERARRLFEQMRAEARAERARLPGLRTRLAHWSGLHAKYLAAARAPWRPMPPDPPEPE